MEDWAEIRRLHRSERLPIREIARRLEVSRNTVRARVALGGAAEVRANARPRFADEAEPQLRALLASFPRMPASVIAERIGWTHSGSILRTKVAELRPEHRGVDPADRLVFRPGQTIQCDLWFPAAKIPVGAGQERILPVLVMVLGFSRVISAVMLPSRQAGDLTSGMWQLIQGLGRCPRTLVWDREAAIGGTGKPSTAAAAFTGSIGASLKLAPARDPEFKGVVERANQYLETSFLPGRIFASPEDFNTQLSEWLPRANSRRVRALGAKPVELFEQDRQGMMPLPPIAPPVGLSHRIRLARDYYVRLDGSDYSADPKFIGRFVDATASPTEVVLRCDGEVIDQHARSWAAHQTITDPFRVETARGLRRFFQQQKHPVLARHHTDGHPVQLRALVDYDALFGVAFTSQEGA